MSQQVGGQIVPPATPAGLGVELQGRVPTGDRGRSPGRDRRQGRPAEVGVKDHPGGVDHRPQARPPQFTNNLLDSGPAGGGLRDCAATTLRLEDLLDGEANERAAMLGDQGAGRLLLEKLMDARQGS